mgnify:FL=1
MDNKIDDYLNSEDLVGLDRFLILQRRLDGYIASRLGITSLAPIGFIVGLIAGFLVFS